MSPERPPSEDGGKAPETGASKGEPEAPGRSPDVPLPARATKGRPARRRRAPDRARQDAWVARLRQGDESALEEVVKTYGERLTAVVSGLLRDKDAVEDVVQATFAKAWFRIGSFKGDSGLYTWLYRVAVNASKDYIKGRSRRPAAALDDRNAVRIPSGEPHVIEGIERRELRQRVRGAIEALPERYRVVLALRELEGMTYDDISKVLGLSLGTVESRLFRARRRLRALLERDEETSGLRKPDDEKGGRL